MNNSGLIFVGDFDTRINEKLNTKITAEKIYRSTGLAIHLKNHNHLNALKYIDRIPDMIYHPDYIGVNPNEKGQSFEIVKRYGENMLLGIKVNVSDNTLYVSTLHEIAESKLQRRLYSGRLVEFK